MAMFITEQVIPGDLQLVLFPVKFVYHTHTKLQPYATEKS